MTDLMTIEQLAELLHYPTVESVYSARRRGQLPPAIKRGNRLLWRRQTVDMWLASREEQPA